MRLLDKEVFWRFARAIFFLKYFIAFKVRDLSMNIFSCLVIIEKMESVDFDDGFRFFLI